MSQSGFNPLIHLMFVGILAFTSCGSNTGGGQSSQPAEKKAAVSIPEVKIGNQVWMARNLNAQTFRNGEAIPQAQSREEFEQAGNNKMPAWCYPDFDRSKGGQYGLMYNWYAVIDPRGLAPEGWHVPSDAEWTLLGENVGDQAGTVLKSTSGWYANANGADTYGFSALPAGGMSALNGYSGEQRVAVFWSATSSSDSFAYYRVLHAPRNGIFREDDLKISGLSVRCVKD